MLHQVRRKARAHMSHTHRGLLLVLAVCVPASLALLPRLLPRRLEAIVLDADGSFLDPNHKVSSANADAVLAARRAGLRVFIATGRARSGPWVKECLVPLSLEAPGVFTQGLTSFDGDNRRGSLVKAPVLAAAHAATCRSGRPLACPGLPSDSKRNNPAHGWPCTKACLKQLPHERRGCRGGPRRPCPLVPARKSVLSRPCDHPGACTKINSQFRQWRRCSAHAACTCGSAGRAPSAMASHLTNTPYARECAACHDLRPGMLRLCIALRRACKVVRDTGGGITLAAYVQVRPDTA